jgi:hypothetical protein
MIEQVLPWMCLVEKDSPSLSGLNWMQRWIHVPVTNCFVSMQVWGYDLLSFVMAGQCDSLIDPWVVGHMLIWCELGGIGGSTWSWMAWQRVGLGCVSHVWQDPLVFLLGDPPWKNGHNRIGWVPLVPCSFLISAVVADYFRILQKR